jgi:hypothetical protein
LFFPWSSQPHLVFLQKSSGQHESYTTLGKKEEKKNNFFNSIKNNFNHYYYFL